jgi:hypothetical protein
MATHRTIAATETDPQAPLVSALFKALDGNATAIAEGALNAPKVVTPALGMYFDAFALDGTTSQSSLAMDRIANVLIDAHCKPSSGAALQIRFSNNNGGSWGSFQSLSAVLSSTAHTRLYGYVNLQTGDYKIIKAETDTAAVPAIQQGTLTVPSNCNAIDIRMGAGTGVQAYGTILGTSGVTP